MDLEPPSLDVAPCIGCSQHGGRHVAVEPAAEAAAPQLVQRLPGSAGMAVAEAAVSLTVDP